MVERREILEPVASVFDDGAIIQARLRAQDRFAAHDFLFKRTRLHMIERLAEIKREFPLAAQIGMRGGRLRADSLSFDLHPALGADGVMDRDCLPLRPASLDLVSSVLDLHSVNDLPGLLLQIRQALKPDGLFIAALLGGESLHELRESLMQAELQLKGGVSPRVFPFADKRQMGALLQRAGFALPVVDSEDLHVSYEGLFNLMHDLRGMGEGNVISARDRRNPGKALFMEAARYYAAHFPDPKDPRRITAHFEIIYLIGWAPHESQQQPLKPGSASHRLADVLGRDDL